MEESYPPIWRPADLPSLEASLVHAGLFHPDAERLCFFPRDVITPWATNRVRLDADTFAEWSRYDLIFVRLPRVWVYPLVDGKSPEKDPAPARSPDTADDRSTATPSTIRQRREEDFRESLLELDGKGSSKFSCLIPGCGVVDVGEGQVEAAHIIPRRILDFRRTSDIYKAVLGAAELVRLNIDSPCNGMLLCPSHHVTFDRYQFTVDPATLTLQVDRDADANLQPLAGKPVDFSHRPHIQRPTPQVWAAYNEFVFTDKGARLDKRSKKLAL